MSPSVCSRLGQSGEDLLRHLREHLAPLAVVAIVLHVVGAHELLAVEGDGYPAVPGVGRVVLQLDEETGLDKQGDQLIDPGCVVVPPPSVHIAAECERQGGLALLAGVELVVDIVRCVGARHVWFVKSDEGIGFYPCSSFSRMIPSFVEEPKEYSKEYQSPNARPG